jgi:hypothetical protein
MKSFIFWNMTPCSPLEVKTGSACYLLHASFFLGLLFDPEDGGDMFFQKVR